MKSKRRFRRLTIVGLARITRPGEKKSEEVYVTNVSRGGIGIYLNNAVKAGITLSVSFPFPDVSGEKENQTRTGTVVWCKRFGGVYAAGIKFDQPL